MVIDAGTGLFCGDKRGDGGMSGGHKSDVSAALAQGYGFSDDLFYGRGYTHGYDFGEGRKDLDVQPAYRDVAESRVYRATTRTPYRSHSPSAPPITMPALSGHDMMMELERREWKQTVGQSGMTPTAFAFLIPVFVVVVFCPL